MEEPGGTDEGRHTPLTRPAEADGLIINTLGTDARPVIVIHSSHSLQAAPSTTRLSIAELQPLGSMT